MSEKRPCAGETCLCHVDAATAVRGEDGQLYCSQRCSEGKGCGHMGCTCGQFPACVPVLRERPRPRPATMG